jgi:uncharacterized repeat protein (TIGR01451 family)
MIATGAVTLGATSSAQAATSGSVTPQLDLSFSPTTITTKQTSALTFTVTNTSELAAKSGWSFTDAMPAGLTVATPAATTTCPSGDVTAATGTASVNVTGNLSAGMASCTVTVNVQAAATGTYTNGPGNVTETDLNPPANATLTATTAPKTSTSLQADAAPAPNASTTWTCSAFGYLFQSPNGTAAPHQIYQVDLATGASTLIGNTADAVNGVGYNTLDNYIYGWDTSTSDLVRVAADGSLTNLGVPAGMAAGVYQVGDFDNAGHLFLQSGGNGNLVWVEIDLAPGSATYGQKIASGTATKPAGIGTMPSDWTYVNGVFYGLASTTAGTGDAHLIAFNATTHATTDLGAVTGTSSAATYGAAYADPSGNVYFSDNVSGNIYRVNPTTLANVLVSNGPPSAGNDGARCAIAPIPTITVTKTVVGRAQSADQFTVGLHNAGGTTLTSATTTGTATTASTTNWPVTQGATYTITDAMAAGSPDAISSYTATAVCTDTTTGNTVTTTGSGPTWTMVVANPDFYSCNVTNTAIIRSVSIVKSATVTPAADQAAAVAGDTISYSYVVTNTGNEPLVTVAVDDPTGGTVTCPTPAAPGLAPGASETCVTAASYTVTQADVDAGFVSDTATATGTDAGGRSTPQSTPSTAVVPTIVAAPAISVVKSASPSDVASYTLGQMITYSYVVTNTGNVTLTDVAPTEGVFTGTGTMSALTCPAGPVSLAPGAQETCTSSYTLTQADIDAGQVSNTATATGTPPSGNPVTSTPSTANIPEASNPAITVVKSASPATVTTAGQSVTYSFVVTNTGTVTLTNATVNEGAFSGTGTPPTVTCPAGAGSLLPGASVTCTATYTVTQADVNAGSVTNTATATGTPPSGTPPVSAPSTATITITPTSALTVVKTANPTAVTTAGQTITYSFLVTNTGNVTLTDVVPTEGSFSGSGTLSGITCPAGAASLAPDASVTCTATYTTTQADVDAGSVSNTATATGTPPSGPAPVAPPSSTTVTIAPAPALTVVKTANPTTVTAVGQTISYSFAVTNTGNTTLTNVTVDEGAFSGTGTAPTVTCPAGAASLAPGDEVTCTATYTTTQADVDSGSVTNTATATGTPPSGTPPVSPPSTATVTVTPAPALTVVKTANPTTVTTVGQTITYSFLITNTGNVTLTDVSPTEGAFTGTGTVTTPSCPAAAASLVPGADVTCTATYTTTQADVDSGSVTNTATATGTPPSGPPTVSPPSSSTVTIPSDPALTVLKSASPSNPDSFTVGQVITYSFVITNTGNVTLTNVAPTDTTFTVQVHSRHRVAPLGPHPSCPALK